MVWGCITLHGVEHLHCINSIIDTKKYCAIFEKSLLGTLCDYNILPCHFTFQQDSNQKHTSHLAICWFKNHNIILLP